MRIPLDQHYPPNPLHAFSFTRALSVPRESLNNGVKSWTHGSQQVVGVVDGQMNEDVAEASFINFLESFSHGASRRLPHQYINVGTRRRPDNALQQQQVFHKHHAHKYFIRF